MVQNVSVAPELARNANYKPSDDDRCEEDTTIKDDGDESTIGTFTSEDTPCGERISDSSRCCSETPPITLKAAAELVTNVMESNPKATQKDILAGAKILRTLIGNVCSRDGPPLSADDTKRRIRLRNPKIQKYIVKVQGALDIMEEAGFVRLVRDHDEFLVFPPDTDDLAASILHQELTTLIRDLQAGRRVTPKVSITKRRRQEREKALLRWKDDNTEEKARLIANRNKLERRREIERQETYEQYQVQRDIFRPYLIPVICAGMAYAAMKDPDRIYVLALYAFVLYWIAIFFTHWASTESLGPFRQYY